MENLAEASDLDNTNRLGVGQTLFIPSSEMTSVGETGTENSLQMKETVASKSQTQTAVDDATSREITGEVISIENDASTFKVKDERGRTHAPVLENKAMLQELEVVAKVKIKISEGRAISVEKVDKSA